MEGRTRALFLTVVLDLVGFRIVMPLLTYQVEDYGASAAQVISLKAIDSVARFLFVPIRVWLSDWVGHRPVPLVSIASRALKLACSG